MTEYHKYIIDEAERRMTVAANDFPVKFNSDMHAHRVIADLLIESGFKPPVDPLLIQVHAMAVCALNFQSFVDCLERDGLTVTVTKTGEA